MIAEMSLSIMHQAFTAARDWDPALNLSVNISPWQLRDAWLSQKIIKVLTETRFPAHRLELEITESALFGESGARPVDRRQPQEPGRKPCARRFRDGLFLARAPARAAFRPDQDRQELRHLPERKRRLRRHRQRDRQPGREPKTWPITAEGVEDAAIEARLKALGCAKAQGWHYGKPLSIAGARRMLAEKRLLVQPPGTPQPAASANQVTDSERRAI
ncbi:EAL domain-containing protein [Ditylenchus destructor]|uniref:EAL domain-containing protein n=1 Tax=Ditylenchus destructor TaxID=166010 RepID=A0AAD4MG54_9BILA|nr:EAL domain-containing protein [Ditylenchus destructor]